MVEQDDDLFMDHESDLSSLVDSESTAGTWVIKLDSIEPGLLLISSIGSDEFSKYFSRPELKRRFASSYEIIGSRSITCIKGANHYIIKQEYNNVSPKSMEKECRNILKHNNSYLTEIKNLEKSLGEMLICEEKESAWLLSTADENRYKLFEEIRMVERINRKKRQWIFQEYSDKLIKLFKQYPNEHTIVKKALKISNSTYHRLMKEA